VGVSPATGNVPTAGDDYSLDCNINRAAIVSSSTVLEVIWVHPNGTVIHPDNPALNISSPITTTMETLTSRLTFLRLRTSQVGMYTCVVKMTIPGVVEDHQVPGNFIVKVASKWELQVHVTYFTKCYYVYLILPAS